MNRVKNKIKKEISYDVKSVKILGYIYNVKIIFKAINSPVLDLEQEDVRISIPNKYKKQTKEVVALVINKMYNMIAEREIERAMEKTRKLLGFAPEDYEISDKINVLGECKDGEIRINKNIVRHRKELIDFIILHEYCHLKYKTHSKKFYELLRKYIPNYKIYMNELVGYKY